MTYPLYAIGRDAAHERAISIGLAEHHDHMAATADTDEDRADHRRAAQACRDNADKWERIGEIAASVVHQVAIKRGRR